jgi:hypothetical protein
MADLKAEIAAANERATVRLATTPTATAARYDRRIGRLVIDLSSGLSVAFKPQHAQGFEHAKPEQLTRIEISPSGLGLHFPTIDADIYLPGLLEGFLGSRNWMAAQLGKAGGMAKSDAKATAVRANGRLGGRPRKEGYPMKEPGLDGRHRDKGGAIQQKRGDTTNKNLPSPIPQFSPKAKLSTMREETGKVSVEAVRREARAIRPDK